MPSPQKTSSPPPARTQSTSPTDLTKALPEVSASQTAASVPSSARPNPEWGKETFLRLQAKWDGVKKAKRAQELADSGKRERSKSPSQGDLPQKKIKEDLMAVSLRKNLKCIAQFDNNEPIGSTKARPGYSIQLKIEGRQLGYRTLTLFFKSNPQDMADNRLVSEIAKQKNFTLEYLPGAKATPKPGSNSDGAPFMIEAFEWKYVSKVANPSAVQRTVLNRTAEKDRPYLVELKVCVTDHIIEGSIDMQSWKQHGEDVQKSIQALETKKYTLHLWCRIPSSTIAYEATSIRPFLSAIEKRLPPPRQYYENREPLRSLKSNPETIAAAAGAEFPSSMPSPLFSQCSGKTKRDLKAERKARAAIEKENQKETRKPMSQKKLTLKKYSSERKNTQKRLAVEARAGTRWGDEIEEGEVDENGQDLLMTRQEGE